MLGAIVLPEQPPIKTTLLAILCARNTANTL